MTTCCQCGREIKTCCDNYCLVYCDGRKTDDVICGECAGEIFSSVEKLLKQR